MASIDTSFYNRPSQLDIADSVEQGMRLGDMIKKRRQDNEIKDIMKSGMTQNPDGSMSYDYKKPMSALMDKGYFQEALDLQDKQAAQQAAQAKMQKEKQERELEEITRAAWSITDQNTYSNALKSLSSKGIDVSQMPQEYNPQMVEHYKRQTLSTKERLDELDKQARLKLERDKLEIERSKLGHEKKKEEKNLPQNVYAAATYAKRLEDANNQIAKISKNWDPTAISSTMQDAKLPIPFIDVPLVPERFKSEEKKLMDQAQRNFVNAVLRRESGSAISESEFDSANRQYFPQAGDTAEVLKQKLRNREVAIAGLKTEGQKALNQFDGNLATTRSQKPGQTVAQTKAPVLKTSEIEWK